MTPNDIQNKTFDKGMGGYKTDEVTNYLGQVADYVRQLEAEKSNLEEKMLVLAEKLEEYREDEDSLRAALIGAQKLGDSVVRDAKAKAEMLLAEAKMKSDELISDAKSSIDKESISLAKMQNEVVEFRSKILAMYKTHIEMIQNIPVEAEKAYKARDIAAKKHVAVAPPPAPVPEEEPEVSFFFKGEPDFDKIREAAEESETTEAILTFEEEIKGIVPEENGPKTKRSNYGNLRFGEDYSLTRKD